jgi:DNA-binding transcriptional MerR regulator
MLPMPRLTTSEAAHRAGINRVTLHEWIRLGKINPPKTILRNGRAVRLWSARDIASLLEVKRETYRRGRGVKKMTKLEAFKGRSGGQRDRRKREAIESVVARMTDLIRRGILRGSWTEEMALQAIRKTFDGHFRFPFPRI